MKVHPIPPTIFETYLNKELTDLFLVRYSLFQHRKSRQRMVNALLIFKINPVSKR